MAARKQAQPEPSHYRVTLKRSFPHPDFPEVRVPAGESTVSADILALIPAELIAAKTPTEA